MENGRSIFFSQRLEIGEQIGNIVVLEYEGRHFHGMANLDPTLKRSLYRPFRQTVGRTTKTGSVWAGRNSVIKCVTAGAICLGKGPALGCTFGKIVCTGIGHASCGK